MSRETPFNGYLVTKQLEGVTKLGVPIYVGDLLTQSDQGVWTRQAPGICLTNIAITEELKQHLEPVKYGSDFLDFWLSEEGKARYEELTDPDNDPEWAGLTQEKRSCDDVHPQYGVYHPEGH